MQKLLLFRSICSTYVEAPTTLLGQRTTTTPRGRSAANEGGPLHVAELLATLEAPAYIERTAIGDATHNAKTLRAVKKALRYQVEGRGFGLIDVLSPSLFSALA